MCLMIGGWLDGGIQLNIMKDSRLGTYGAAALFIGLGIKWVTLRAELAKLNPLLPAYAFIVVH